MGSWVLLCYRLPREPSGPRVAVWRRLRKLGVAQLGDGTVALPADARTQEQLEWVADQVSAADGTSTVWLAQPGSLAQEKELAATMAGARGDEYTALTEKAEQAQPGDLRALRRLRRELREIGRRDFFPPPQRETARRAVDALARHGTPTPTPDDPATADSHNGAR
jgi:hypothetical protein